MKHDAIGIVVVGVLLGPVTFGHSYDGAQAIEEVEVPVTIGCAFVVNARLSWQLTMQVFSLHLRASRLNTACIRFKLRGNNQSSSITRAGYVTGRRLFVLLLRWGLPAR